jgi:hypothetical protein
MAPKTERILCVDKYVTKSWFNNTGDAAWEDTYHGWGYHENILKSIDSQILLRLITTQTVYQLDERRDWLLDQKVEKVS